ncbi:MAG: dynamin family protein, partial [Gemmatimonadaceae bacterium]
MACVERVAAALAADELASEIAAVRRRLRGGEVHVVCVGQGNRGKSSLINALVGVAVLPVGIVPVTAVATHVRYGTVPAARVSIDDGTTATVDVRALVDYVSEARNPGNRRGVARVDVEVPAPLLTQGIVVIDTPGVGSVLPSAGAAGHAVLPHADAVLFVAGVDPPISDAELAAVFAAACGTPVLLVAINKTDASDAQDLADARAFLAHTLRSRLGRPVEGIFAVSAREQLAGGGPARDWEGLWAALRRLTAQDHETLMARAALRESRALVQRGLDVLADRSRCAYQPVADCDERIAAIRGAQGNVAFHALMIDEHADRELARLRRFAHADRLAFLDVAIEDGARVQEWALGEWGRLDALIRKLSEEIAAMEGVVDRGVVVLNGLVGVDSAMVELSPSGPAPVGDSGAAGDVAGAPSSVGGGSPSTPSQSGWRYALDRLRPGSARRRIVREERARLAERPDA